MDGIHRGGCLGDAHRPYSRRRYPPAFCLGDLIMRLLVALSASLLMAWFFALPLAADELNLDLRHQVETSPNSGRYHTLLRREAWKPEETALIVCDVWDAHHCLNAVRRVEELAPRLEKVLAKAREQGVT